MSFAVGKKPSRHVLQVWVIWLRISIDDRLSRCKRRYMSPWRSLVMMKLRWTDQHGFFPTVSPHRRMTMNCSLSFYLFRFYHESFKYYSLLNQLSSEDIKGNKINFQKLSFTFKLELFRVSLKQFYLDHRQLQISSSIRSTFSSVQFVLFMVIKTNTMSHEVSYRINEFLS